jgi:hypothetical protein
MLISLERTAGLIAWRKRTNQVAFVNYKLARQWNAPQRDVDIRIRHVAEIGIWGDE